MPRNPIESEWRFWPKVLPVESGCWEWQAFRCGNGYGRFSGYGCGKILASRFVYELCVGPIPFGLKVLHRCDNPSCVNPAHLFLGTMKDNSEDMVRKGRHRNQNTAKPICKHGHSLTPDNVYISQNKRQCRTCTITRSARKRAARHAAELAIEALEAS